MAEAPLAVASAVILPEAEEAPPLSLKRRQSSASGNDSKRRRVSHDEDTIKQESASTPPAKPEARNGQLESGQATEERKRGRRLFGALLGTLSQSSSSSTAQKRRTDIEKKQQAKLKQQTEKADERKKEKLEALMKVRRTEQRIYDRQSMKIRHSNLLAQAHFLQTKADPKLFYKPWKLTTDGEDAIKTQLREAEEIIERELAQWEVDNPPLKEEPQEEKAVKTEEDKEMETVGDQTNKSDPPLPEIPSTTNSHDRPANDEHKKTQASEAANHHGAEGEEMVEGEEDTVIY